MTNVRISNKGKILLKNKRLSKLVLRAIGKNGDALNKKDGLTVVVGSKKLTLKNASSANDKVVVEK